MDRLGASAISVDCGVVEGGTRRSTVTRGVSMSPTAVTGVVALCVSHNRMQPQRLHVAILNNYELHANVTHEKSA